MELQGKKWLREGWQKDQLGQTKRIHLAIAKA